MADNAIRLPEPIGLQPGWLESAASRKVHRVGRRGTKSRFAMVAGIDGHGPRDPKTGKRKFPGVLQGGDVVWVAQDYPNLSTVMWREEFVPRFKHLPFVNMNANEHYIQFQGLGTLFLRPETAIGGIRGIGKNLVGVILDEAAFYDLEAALKDVILPALLDNNGWLIIMSTTNAGLDGNPEKRTPSYFNVLCEQIRAKQRGPEWEEFTGTAYDNPRLSKAAIDELVAEYDADSPSLQQEVFAALLKGGAGLALPNLSAATHMIDRFPIPSGWQRWGSFDWGYFHPFCYGEFAADEDGVVYLVDSLHGLNGSRLGLQDLRKLVPLKQLDAIRHFSQVDRLWPIVAGHDCWSKKQALGQNTPSVQEQWMGQNVILTQASIDRVPGLTNLRHYAEVEPGVGPMFRIMDTPGNRYTLKVLEGMQIDPKRIEDALKVDASPTTGFGGDDPYDMVRYGLGVRPYATKKKAVFSLENAEGDVENLVRWERSSDTLAPWEEAQRNAGDDYGHQLGDDQ